MVSLLIQNIVTPYSVTPIKTNKKVNKPIICLQSEQPKFLPALKYTNKVLLPNTELCVSSNVAGSNLSKMRRHRRGDELVVEVEKDMSSKERMLGLCGVGYWMQGFRCFPWLALNFHMANNLQFDPSTLQLVQNCSNLPMVAKPLFGVLSDVLHIGGANRIPYICIGVVLQVLSWGPLALLPVVGDSLCTLMACVLVSNLGAAITEVAQDALVAEYGQKHKMVGLQAYTFMAIAVAGILGNSFGGVLLLRTHPRTIIFIFAALLVIQLLISASTKEEYLGISKPSSDLVGQDSILSNTKRQFSELLVALSGDKISHPLMWIVASIAMVPMLTGSIFCYQTQFLNLDPSVIGMSKVIGQVLLLSLTVLYERSWKSIPMRKLITIVQVLYAASLLLDLALFKQINLKIGIPNYAFAVCFSGLAETIATFKTVPFFVLIASLCPPGCAASVIAFLASALTLSSIISGFLGIGVASVLGITSDNYSNLPIGIMLQCFAALVPLIWINNLPISLPTYEKEMKKGRSKRSRRNRRVGRVVLNSIFSYRPKRESEKQR